MSEGRPLRIGVFHPHLGFGGSEGFALWTLEALKRDHCVALLAGGRIDLPTLNAFCGTAIDASNCEIVELRLSSQLAKAEWGAALRGALVERSMRRHLDRFDVLISSYNVVDFGRPAIHHLADFSWDETLRRHYDPAPPRFRRMLHTNSRLRQAYLTLTKMIAGHHEQTSLVNAGLILANSIWSRKVIRERFGIETEVVYPPVKLQAMVPSSERNRHRIVCLGRVYPEKRIEQIIEIIKAVRGRGHEITLHIVGDTRETAYGRKIEQLSQVEGNWIVHEGRQFGEAKARLLSECAYGIHARPAEPFGIAIAEMITAGCIPFVPAEGGPAEIVDHNPALLYETPQEAVEKIDSMLRNPTLERATRLCLQQRSHQFSADSFMREIRRVVDEFAASRTEQRSMAKGQLG